MRARLMRAACRGVLLTSVATLLGAGPARAQTPACMSAVDPSAFASTSTFEQRVRTIGGFGLRLPATAEHNRLLDWLEEQASTIPGGQVRTEPYRMTRWQPTTRATAAPGLDLGAAGKLTVDGGGEVPVAGPLVYTRPTTKPTPPAELVYLPAAQPITPANAAGKIVLRDLPLSGIPYAALIGLSYFDSPDLLTRAGGSYTRPFVTSGATTDIEAATKAGAVGIVQAFDVPTEQVRGYFDPHDGTLQHIPGLWVGADGREQLKALARQGKRFSMQVKARIDPEQPTRNLIVTIPGQTAEKVALITNTDGNTFVQENSSAALLAVGDYYARLPLDCRTKTLELAFTSAHLAYSYDGAAIYARNVLRDPDHFSYAFVVEHLGGKELLPVPRSDGGPGQVLTYTGEPEPYAWFAPTESPALSTAVSDAVAQSGQSDSAVIRGLDLPSPGRFPVNCNFGGLANFFHGQNIPAIGGIAGPWSLWAPNFGIDAVDFERMRRQSISVADTILTLDDVPRDAIQGTYPAGRAAVRGGAPTCDEIAPKRIAPGAPAPLRVSAKTPKRLSAARPGAITCTATGGSGPRTCTVKQMTYTRRGARKAQVVARGTVPLPDSGSASVALKLTAYGRALAKRLPEGGRRVLLLSSVEDNYDMVRGASVRSTFVRR